MAYDVRQGVIFPTLTKSGVANLKHRKTTMANATIIPMQEQVWISKVLTTLIHGCFSENSFCSFASEISLWYRFSLSLPKYTYFKLYFKKSGSILPVFARFCPFLRTFDSRKNMKNLITYSRISLSRLLSISNISLSRTRSSVP